MDNTQQNQKEITRLYLQFAAKLQELNLKQQQVISDYVKSLEQKKISNLEKKIFSK